jgi:hypothetical protein
MDSTGLGWSQVAGYCDDGFYNRRKFLDYLNLKCSEETVHLLLMVGWSVSQLV